MMAVAMSIREPGESNMPSLCECALVPSMLQSTAEAGRSASRAYEMRVKSGNVIVGEADQ
jgi:hypothetical protein